MKSLRESDDRIRVSASKQKQPSPFYSGGTGEVRRCMSVIAMFVLLARVEGQDAGGNGGTNQPIVQAVSTNQPAAQTVPTNSAPVQNIETPLPPSAVIDELQAQNPGTNQMGTTPSGPPPIGPSSLGGEPTATPFMGTSALTGPGGGFGGGTPQGPGIQLWGPVNIYPRLTYNWTETTGLSAQPGQPATTEINTVSPGFILGVGRNWSLNYGPAFAFYSNPEFKNTIDETVTLRGNWTSVNWVLGLSQSYVSTDQPLVETGAQTSQTAYITGLTAFREMGTAFSLQLALNQSFRDAQGFTDLESWSGTSWLNYQWGTSFGVSLGLILGYDKIDPGSDSPFEELQGRITFHPGERFSLVVSGGAEDMQFIGPSAPSLISPIFSASVMYHIFPSTIFTLFGRETVNPSLFANEVEVVTTVGATIRQTISSKLLIEANATYATEPETSIVPGPLPKYYLGSPPDSTLQQVSSDTTTSYRVTLTYTMLKRLSIAAFYSLSENTTGQANFAYSSRQIGLSLRYRY